MGQLLRLLASKQVSGGFNPLSIAGLDAWYDPSDASTISTTVVTPTKGVFVTPAERAVLTNSVLQVVTINSPTDASMNFAVDGVVLGAMTAAGGGDFTYNWTPSSVDASALLTGIGNVTGVTSERITTVDAANTLNTTMTAWTQSNTTTTVAAGVTHPMGSGTVYKVAPSASGSARRLFFTSPSGAGTIPQHGLDIWAGYIEGSVTKVLSYNDGSGIGKIDIVTEETSASNMYTIVVERKTVNGIVWKRIQFVRLDNASTATTSAFFDLQRTIEEAVVADSYGVTAGELPGSGIYLCNPRRVDDVKLPFTAHMKMAAYRNTAQSAALGVTNAEQWWYKHPFVDSETNMAGGIGGISIRVVKPSGWVSTGSYPCLVFLKAQTDGAESSGGNQNAWQTATAAADAYANTYNCVVVVADERAPEGYWGGVLSGGTKNMHDFFGIVLVPWLSRVLAVSTARNDHILIGYSKGGNLAVSQLLMYPQTWGYAGSWDGAFLNVYPANNANINYSNATDYNARDPAQILNTYLSSVLDRKRLVIKGGFSWASHYTSFVNQLSAAGVQATTAYATAIKHAWGPTGENTGWTPVMVADLFAARALPESATNVYQINDKSKNNRHLKALTGSTPQTGITTSVKGKNFLNFNGSNNYLQTDDSTLSAQPRTIFIVAKANAVADNKTLISGKTINSGEHLIRAIAGKWGASAGLEFTTVATSNTGQLIHCVIFNSASSEYYLDGILNSSGNVFTNSSAGIIVGARPNAAGYWNGNIGEILVYNAVLSSTNRDAVNNYLLGKW